MAIQIEGLRILLQVFDMPTSLTFYRDVLGFNVVQSSPQCEDCDWCWLRRGQIELMLNTQFETAERSDRPDPERILKHSDVWLYFDCPDVDATFAYLQSKGIVVQTPVDREYGMRQLTIADPDGYMLCFQSPRHDTRKPT